MLLIVLTLAPDPLLESLGFFWITSRIFYPPLFFLRVLKTMQSILTDRWCDRL